MYTNKFCNRLWLVFPFFEPSTTELITIIKSIRSTKINQKILLVDDGAGISIPANINNVQIINHRTRRGKGSAILTAVEYISNISAQENEDHTFILTADSDGQHCAEDILKMIDEWGLNVPDDKKPTTLLIGQRDFRKSYVPLCSKIGRWISSLLIKLETGIYIYDTQCGLRIYPISLFKNSTLNSKGFELETEILVAAIKNGYEIKTIPIKTIYYPNRKSNYKKISDSLKILFLHFQIAIGLVNLIEKKKKHY